MGYSVISFSSVAIDVLARGVVIWYGLYMSLFEREIGNDLSFLSTTNMNTAGR